MGEMRKIKHLLMAYTLSKKCVTNFCKVQFIVEDVVTFFLAHNV